jgi:rhodanese-related sulfurtransferase
MQQATTKFHTITLNDLKEKVLHSHHTPVLINVLSEESFQKSNGLRLPGSYWIPNAEVDRKVPLMFSKNKEMVVYCSSFDCTASEKAAEKLQDMGYTNVHVYKGGVKEWKEAGLPMETNQEMSGCCGGTSSCGCD